MKITDLTILNMLEERLSAVQLRKSALQKFMSALDLEEQQIHALRKTYVDNKELYDLIEDEPVPEKTPPSIPKIKIISEKTNKGSVKQEISEAVITAVSTYGEATTQQIHNAVMELRPGTGYDSTTKIIYSLVDIGILKKIKHKTYTLTTEAKEKGF